MSRHLTWVVGDLDTRRTSDARDNPIGCFDGAGWSSVVRRPATRCPDLRVLVWTRIDTARRKQRALVEAAQSTATPVLLLGPTPGC